MTSQEQIAEQLFAMRKVRVEFHLDDGSVHQGYVVRWSHTTSLERVHIDVNNFSILVAGPKHVG